MSTVPQTGFTGEPAVEQPAAVTGGVAAWLERNARAFPGKPAVIHPDGRGSGSYATLTYGELQEKVEELARGFRRAGITRGTRTVLMAPPGPELFALCFALFRVGAVPVVVDPGMGVRRMLHCYRAVGAEAFIGPPLAHLVRVLGRRTFAGVRVPVTLGRRRLGRGHTLAELRATSATGRYADETAQPGGDDLLMIGFTTGSTGPAKGVEYTHRMALSIAGQIEAVHGRTRDDVSLVTLPFYGVLDLVYGSTLVLAPLAPPRSPRRTRRCSWTRWNDSASPRCSPRPPCCGTWPGTSPAPPAAATRCPTCAASYPAGPRCPTRWWPRSAPSSTRRHGST